MMGGVDTDIDGATGLAGLYAAGEAACVSINGANRLGSNSLPECLVFGARAGRAAARFAGTSPATAPSAAVLAQGRDEERRLERELARHVGGGQEHIADIRTEMQDVMENGAGIYRDGVSLTKAADTLLQLRERFDRVAMDDHSRTFNTDVVALLELSFMLDVAETVVHCALRREESRGAHQRTDFPARNDQRFLAHSLIRREPDGTLQVEYRPVTVTRWSPGERVYGR
jgi:fumarate reductase flavoprotein subunit